MLLRAERREPQRRKEENRRGKKNRLSGVGSLGRKGKLEEGLCESLCGCGAGKLLCGARIRRWVLAAGPQLHLRCQSTGRRAPPGWPCALAERAACRGPAPQGCAGRPR